MNVPLIDGLLNTGLKIIDELWTSDEEAAEEKRKLLELHQKGELAELQARVSLLQGQLAINAKEAEHSSIFVAGWRPFVGWVCGSALAYAAIVEPLLRFGATMYGYDGTFPVIDTSITLQVLLGMLGLAGMRTREKEKGVARKS